jgi:hypothetical protein
MCDHDWGFDTDYYVCRNCHRISTIYIDSIETSFTSQIIYVPYTPITHFKAKLQQLQGKENADIPEEIIEKCRGCKNQKDVLSILKSLKKPKFYKNLMKICNILKIKVPHFSFEEETKILSIFKQKLPLKMQSNNISYNFILYKIIQMIGRHDVLPFIQITKNKQKLKRYETIFNSFLETKT